MLNNNYSRFWIDSQDTNMVDELLGIEQEKTKGRDLVALASYRRAIGNFVNIVTGKNIPVEFNSNDNSYTDGKKVVLGANLNDKNFDVAVGLALHEGRLKIDELTIIYLKLHPVIRVIIIQCTKNTIIIELSTKL